MNQHLIRSVLAIRDQGGVALKDGSFQMPAPIIAGRNADKIEALVKAHGVERFITDLDAALAHRDDTLFFDAASTQMRPGLLKRAIDAGKHVYSEKSVSCHAAAHIGPASTARIGRSSPTSIPAGAPACAETAW